MAKKNETLKVLATATKEKSAFQDLLIRFHRVVMENRKLKRSNAAYKGIVKGLNEEYRLMNGELDVWECEVRDMENEIKTLKKELKRSNGLRKQNATMSGTIGRLLDEIKRLKGLLKEKKV